MLARRPPKGQRRQWPTTAHTTSGYKADCDTDNESDDSLGHQSGYDAASELYSSDSSSDTDYDQSNTPTALAALEGASKADTTTSGATTEQGESASSSDADAMSDTEIAEWQRHVNDTTRRIAAIEALLKRTQQRQLPSAQQPQPDSQIQTPNTNVQLP